MLLDTFGRSLCDFLHRIKIVRHLNIVHTWRLLLQGCTELTYPSLCRGCKVVLPKSDILCANCEKKIQRWPTDRPLKERISSTSKVELLPPLGVYEKDGLLAQLIHDFKYKGHRYLGASLSLRYAELLSVEKSVENYELVIPVPMHWWRLSRRGFNQSTVIAHTLANQLKLPLCLHVLRRRRYTRRQVGMSAAERKKNIKNSFVVRRPTTVRSKKVLLVDDVFTTGATTLACTEVLLNEGVDRVGISVIALRG